MELKYLMSLLDECKLKNPNRINQILNQNEQFREIIADRAQKNFKTRHRRTIQTVRKRTNLNRV